MSTLTLIRQGMEFMRNAVGNNSRFFAHAAKYDVEALIPYWDCICNRIGVRR